MSDVTKLNRAIVKLESSRPYGGVPWRLSPPDGAGDYAIQERDGFVVAFGVHERAARAAVVAVNTIDAQLAILRSAFGDSSGSHDEPNAFRLALELADAILGGDS